MFDKIASSMSNSHLENAIRVRGATAMELELLARLEAAEAELDEQRAVVDAAAEANFSAKDIEVFALALNDSVNETCDMLRTLADAQIHNDAELVIVLELVKKLEAESLDDPAALAEATRMLAALADAGFSTLESLQPILEALGEISKEQP